MGSSASADVEAALRSYASILPKWARSVAARMLADVSRRDERAWSRIGQNMTRQLRREVLSAPVGSVMRQRLDETTRLITSIPIEAAERVRQLATEALVTGARAGEIRGRVPKPGLAEEILRTGEVTVSRANLIARTEVTRTATALVRARAEHVGSPGYIWRTAGDRDVRKEHRRLAGTFHRWDDPPVAEANGVKHHPGEFPNCRCYPEVVVPDIDEIEAARS